jgi:hypothetical protein
VKRQIILALAMLGLFLALTPLVSATDREPHFETIGEYEADEPDTSPEQGSGGQPWPTRIISVWQYITGQPSVGPVYKHGVAVGNGTVVPWADWDGHDREIILLLIAADGQVDVLPITRNEVEDRKPVALPGPEPTRIDLAWERVDGQRRMLVTTQFDLVTGALLEETVLAVLDERVVEAVPVRGAQGELLVARSRQIGDRQLIEVGSDRDGWVPLALAGADEATGLRARRGPDDDIELHWQDGHGAVGSVRQDEQGHWTAPRFEPAEESPAGPPAPARSRRDVGRAR